MCIYVSHHLRKLTFQHEFRRQTKCPWISSNNALIIKKYIYLLFFLHVNCSGKEGIWLYLYFIYYVNWRSKWISFFLSLFMWIRTANEGISVCTYIYIYMYMYICIYVNWSRKWRYFIALINICLFIYLFIFMWIGTASKQMYLFINVFIYCVNWISKWQYFTTLINNYLFIILFIGTACKLIN